jgi:putative endonuclease
MGFTQHKGKSAEEFAKAYLQRQGLSLVSQNYRCKYGEIDLIMRDKKTTVFVEVRYRKSQHFGSGAETVNYHKQRKLLATASHYLQNNPKAAKQPCRFDVLSLTAQPSSDAEDYAVQWIADAIQAQ